MKKKRVLKIIYILLILVIVFGFFNGLEKREITVVSKNLPDEFDGFKIIHISDLHGEYFGENQEDLIKEINKENPDIIAFTGDMVDEEEDSLLALLDLIKGLNGKYPIYAVTGNHEDDKVSIYQELLSMYEEYKVKLINNKSEFIEKNGKKIGIYGKSYRGGYYNQEFLESPDYSKADFNILLYHDATAFPVVSNIGYDLMLAGHTHGGIIRLPLIGGLVNNRGELFSEYDNGKYIKNNAVLISSRGLGAASLPRFNNNKDLIVVKLEKHN